MERLWWHIRRLWARLWGAQSVGVTLRLRELTYERYERACLLVGLDPDDVRDGQQGLSDAEIGDVYETGPKLASLLCENDEHLKALFARAERPVAEQICAHLLTRFFFRCMRRWSDRAKSLNIMPNGAA